MSKSALRNVIRELSKALADAIVKAINSHSLHELAALTEERSSDPRPRSKAATHVPAPKALPAKTKPKRKPHAPKKKAAPKLSTSKVSSEDTRNGILAVLRDSKDWLSASEILAALKHCPKEELFGRVVRTLVTEGHIARQGATRNTKYQITASGLAR